VTEGLLQLLPLSMTEEETWFEQMMHSDKEQHPLAIEIRDGDGWRLAGNAGLFHLEWTNRSAEFGIFIGDKSLWDKGYGTEVLQVFLQHAFDTLNLNRIYLRVFATNARARRSYEKASLAAEGTMRQAVFRNGQYIDVHVMSILSSEWRKGREGK
jgi:RimJ/RimL family protein N-acetyltransferase